MKAQHIIPIVFLGFALITSCKEKTSPAGKENENHSEDTVTSNTADSSLYPIGTNLREMIFSRPASYDTAFVYAHKDLGKDTVLREEFINGGWEKYDSKEWTFDTTAVSYTHLTLPTIYSV